MINKKNENTIYLIILCTLPFILYGKVLFTGKMLYGTDWLAGTIMQREFFVNMIKNFHIFPLWNPLQFAGIPTGEGFFGDIFYYPTLILKMIFPLHIVWTLIFIIHPIAAGIGTYLFMKNKINNKLISFFTAIIFMFTGVIISEVYGGHDGRIMVASLLPFLIYFMDNGFYKGKLYYFGFAAIISSLMFLTGHIQSSYYAIVFVIFYIAYLHINNDFNSKYKNYTFLSALIVGFLFSLINKYLGFIIFSMLIITIPQFLDKTFSKKSLKIYMSLIVFVVLTGLLSSVQYLPIFRFLPYAARGVERTYQYSVSWSMGIHEFFDLFFPGFSGINVASINTYWGENPFKLHIRYIGILPMLFALGILFSKNKNEITKFFSVSFIIVLFLAFGGHTPFYRIFYSLFPYVNKFRAPELIFFLASFSISVLTGYYLAKEDKNKKTMYIISGIIIFTGILIIIMPDLFINFYKSTINGFQIDQNSKMMKLANLKTSIYELKGIVFINIIFILFAIYGLFFMNDKYKNYFLIILSLIMLFDLWSKENKYIIPVETPEKYFSSDQIVNELKKDNDIFRVFPFAYRNDDYLALFNIQSISGNHPSPFADYQKFINNPTSVMFNPQLLLMKPERIKFLNVKYLISQYIPEDTAGYDERSKSIIMNYNSLFNKMGFIRYKKFGKFMILKSEKYIPRIYAVNNYIVSEDLDNTLNLIDKNEFDYTNTVILNKKPEIILNENSLVYNISNIKYSPNKIEFEINTNNNCIIVLSDQYYKAWKCFIDNNEVKIIKANGVFRGIEVSKGKHKIVLKFDKTLQLISLLIFLLGFAIIIIIIFYERYKKNESIGNNTDI